MDKKNRRKTYPEVQWYCYSLCRARRRWVCSPNRAPSLSQHPSIHSTKSSRTRSSAWCHAPQYIYICVSPIESVKITSKQYPSTLQNSRTPIESGLPPRVTVVYQALILLVSLRIRVSVYATLGVGNSTHKKHSSVSIAAKNFKIPRARSSHDFAIQGVVETHSGTISTRHKVQKQPRVRFFSLSDTDTRLPREHMKGSQELNTLNSRSSTQRS